MLLTRLDHYTDLLEQMWDTGARNFFIVNEPPLDRSPFIQGGDADSIARYASNIKVFNDNLPKHVATFQDKHPDVSRADSMIDSMLTSCREWSCYMMSTSSSQRCWMNRRHMALKTTLVRIRTGVCGPGASIFVLAWMMLLQRTWRRQLPSLLSKHELCSDS